MKDSSGRRSFIKKFTMGGAGLFATSCGLTARMQAKIGASGLPVPGLSPEADSSPSPYQTLCGVFDPVSLADTQTLGAQAVRLLFLVDDIEAVANNDMTNSKFLFAISMAEAGIQVVPTLHWISGQNPMPLPAEGSTMWNAWLSYASSFVPNMNAALTIGNANYLNIVSLENEAVLDYELSDWNDSSGTSNAIVWLTALAETVKTAVTNTGQPILIASPALTSFPPLHSGESTAVKNALNQLVAWAGSSANVDLIDLHTHVTRGADVTTAINWTYGKTTKPTIITEWSNSGYYTDFLAANYSPGQTNEQFIAACVATPVSLSVWNAFVASADPPSTYMMAFFKAMQQGGVQQAFYGGASQYGGSSGVEFAIDELYANLTAVAPPEGDGDAYPNYDFVDWYQSLVTYSLEPL